jgi:UDP-GlcNAc:undecaprenyl-phosphate GlcNAc-1-phosphate transferase
MDRHAAMALAMLILTASFVATVLLVPAVIRLAHTIGAVDYGGHRKIHHTGIPRLGGLAVALPFLALCLAEVVGRKTSLLFTGDPAGDAAATHRLLLMLLAGGALVLLGLVDDLRNLSSRQKFLVQGSVALAVCLHGGAIAAIELPWGGSLALTPLLGIPLTLLWLVGVTNAVNLIDGIDGLAGLVALCGVVGLAALPLLHHPAADLWPMVALAGSLAAFLCFNFHPASIFLGDTGSIFLGFMLALLALRPLAPDQPVHFPIAALIILGYPIFDTLSSMGRRMLHGHHPFMGDRGHTHHRLLARGWSHWRVTLTLAAAVAVMVLLALPWLLPPASSLGRPLLRLAGAVGALAVLAAIAWGNGYLNLPYALQVIRHRMLALRHGAFIKYLALALREPHDPRRWRYYLRLCLEEFDLEMMELVLRVEGQPERRLALEREFAAAAQRSRATAVLPLRRSDHCVVEVHYRPLPSPPAPSNGATHGTLTEQHPRDLRQEQIALSLGQLFERLALEELVDNLSRLTAHARRESHPPEELPTHDGHRAKSHAGAYSVAEVTASRGT